VVEIVEFAMGRDAWDLSEADSEEGEEGVIDVGALATSVVLILVSERERQAHRTKMHCIIPLRTALCRTALHIQSLTEPSSAVPRPHRPSRIYQIGSN